MANNNNKLTLDRISRDTVYLNSQTVTTARAVSNQPICVYDVLPSDKFSVNLEQFNRIDSLPVSAFASFKNRLAAFYVKNSQIWKPYDSYKSGAPYAFGYVNTVPQKKPYLSMADLMVLFMRYPDFNLTTRTAQLPVVADPYAEYIESHQYDFLYIQTEAAPNTGIYGFKLTQSGKIVYKILYQLGYRIPCFVDDDSNTPALSQYVAVEQSLFPLMAYLSIMCNYYHPLKWRSFEFVNSMSYLIDPVPQHFTQPTAPTTDMKNFWISVCRLLIYAYYGDDYFTSALVDPFATTHGESQQNYVDPLDAQQHADVGYNFNPVIYNNYNNEFSQYILYALSTMTGQAQISALTLNDVNKATLAKFGYKAECADMVPFLLDKVEDIIKIIPEMSFADTTTQGTSDGAPIGYKAGSGEGYMKFSNKFHFDTYGTFIIVNSVMPNYFYPYGLRRQLLRVKRDEEFDRNKANLGYMAVARVELDSEISQPRGTFGFKRQYADYARANDILGGDFVINTQNNALDVFHLARKVPRTSANDEAFSIADSGLSSRNSISIDGRGDGIQFNRIFTQELSDPIQQWYLINIVAHRPISGDISVGEHDGEQLDIDSVANVVNS